MIPVPFPEPGGLVPERMSSLVVLAWRRRLAGGLALLLLVAPLLAPLRAAPTASQAWQAVTAGGESVLRGGGEVAGEVSRQLGGAVTRVYDDATGGNFLFVAGPARTALNLAPQVHTAVRNSMSALENARREKAAQAASKGWRRHLPAFARSGMKAPVPLTRDVVARQFWSPFSLPNLLATVGFAAAGGLLHAALDEDVRWQDSLDFLGDRGFWGGVVGSGIGYGLASLVALSIFPVGGTLLPTVAPMIVGSIGSMLGWMLGRSLAEGESFSDSVRDLSALGTLGKAAGSVAGVALGVTVGAALGGTAGAIAGPIGAVAGALLLRNLGSDLGEEAGEGLQETLRDRDGVVVPLRGRYAEVYELLVDALGRNDQDAAQRHLEELRDLAAEDPRSVELAGP